MTVYLQTIPGGGYGLGVDGLSMQEIENMIDMFDDDGNRELSIDEFVYAFKDAV